MSLVWTGDKQAVSEGGKAINRLAADVFDFHFTYHEIVTEQVNEEDST
jgi:hypothetical protein